jgi:hypothetical protein
VNNEQGVHGGFDIKDKDAVVIKGKANENISGVFPFFITKEHWEIANMLNRMLVGWVCTLDIFGFDYTQLRTLPFMIISKFVEDLLYHPNGISDSRILNLF